MKKCRIWEVLGKTWLRSLSVCFLKCCQLGFIIEIIDNGLGFPIEETKKLIKPYYTTKQKGTGLGLSIVNKIISDHNGSINFNSQENGAKVQINLPLNNVNWNINNWWQCRYSFDT